MENVPKHIGIIPDGNRRCAKRLMLKPWKGHEWGNEKLKEVFEWCKDAGIRIITVYALSLENIEKRPKYELNFLFNLTRREVKDIIENKNHFVHKNRIKVIFFGKLNLLPRDLRKYLKKAMDMTKNYKNYVINFAIAYGGRQEIIDTCKKIGFAVKLNKIKPEQINESLIKESLYTNGLPEPELIIRTGGEKRISNFLLFQSAYSELAFIDSFWPDLTKKQFMTTIHDFSARERRMGK